MAEKLRQETPTLARVIKDAIEARVLELHTAMPGAIVSYNFATNLAQVKPHFKKKYKKDDVATAIQIISNVPVAHLRMGVAHVRLPVTVGDTGLLLFSERSLDEWLSSGVDHDPKDPRTHALSDAIFYPGLAKSSDIMLSSSDSDSAEIRNGNAFIELKKNGKFNIGNSSQELVDLFDQLITVIVGMTTSDPNTGGGIPILNPISSASQSSLSAIQTKLGELKD